MSGMTKTFWISADELKVGDEVLHNDDTVVLVNRIEKDGIHMAVHGTICDDAPSRKLTTFWIQTSDVIGIIKVKTEQGWA